MRERARDASLLSLCSGSKGARLSLGSPWSSSPPWRLVRCLLQGGRLRGGSGNVSRSPSLTLCVALYSLSLPPTHSASSPLSFLSTHPRSDLRVCLLSSSRSVSSRGAPLRSPRASRLRPSRPPSLLFSSRDALALSPSPLTSPSCCCRLRRSRLRCLRFSSSSTSSSSAPGTAEVSCAPRGSTRPWCLCRCRCLCWMLERVLRSGSRPSRAPPPTPTLSSASIQGERERETDKPKPKVGESRT